MPLPEPNSIFLEALDTLLQDHPVRSVVFASDRTDPPLFSYVVNFPRLEVPLRGCYEMEIEQQGRPTLITPSPGTALLVPPNCWNRPTWKRQVRIMSFLFGRKQLGISLVSSGRDGSLNAEKMAIPRPLTGPGEKILQSILELHHGNSRYPAFPALVAGLLHCMRSLIAEPGVDTGSRPHRLLEEICFFLQNNYQEPLTRDGVAGQFGITGNHLSRLFRQQGHMGFIEYLTYVRIDRAKFLLVRYPMRLDEIARRCGYDETAYFCRVFRRITRKTPSEYRNAARGAGSAATQVKGFGPSQRPPRPPAATPKRRK